MASTLRKAFVLLSCTFLGLICGTLYLYLSYSPQLADRLAYSVSDSSRIALVGTLGVAVLGPIAGSVVDRHGYTAALLCGEVAIVAGYLGLKGQYDAAYSSLGLSCVLLFMVGGGSTFINLACLKCCAVSFPSLRGVATLLPLALYGLLALFYSVTATVFFAGQTLAFLGFLAYLAVAIFAVCAPSVMLCDREHAKKASHSRSVLESIEMSTFGTPAPQPHARYAPVPSGFGLVSDPRFWLIFLLTGALAALGQMYIYSVGYMVKALISISVLEASPDAQAQVAALIQNDQQIQVGLLLVANCVGRIVSGIMGDIVAQLFHGRRLWLLFVPCVGLFSTQIMAHETTHYSGLLAVSLLTGFFYGFTFCLMPILVGDVFGMENFSSNWGVVGLAPILPSFYFTSLFGTVYDSHLTVSEAGVAACHIGNGCYSSIFALTAVVAGVSVVVAGAFNFGSRLWGRNPLETRK